MTATSTTTATPSSLPARLADAPRGDTSLRRFLHGLPGVDQVGIEQRAAGLGTRSIKKAAKLWAIDTAISMVDLTTLEGADTHGKVRSLAAKARRPDPDRPDTPQVAAVCVYPDPADGAAVEAGRRGRRSGQRRHRGRHGDRPGRVPVRALRPGVRRDRRGQGGLR